MTDTHRKPFTIRLKDDAKERFGELALKHSLPTKRVTISDVVRASFVVAAKHSRELDEAIIRIRGEEA